MKQQPILVVTGAPCVGKSTLADALLARGNEKYVILNGELCNVFAWPGELSRCRKDWVKLCVSLSGQIDRAVVFYLDSMPDLFDGIDEQIRSRMSFAALVCDEVVLLHRAKEKLGDAAQKKIFADGTTNLEYIAVRNRAYRGEIDGCAYPEMERLDTTGQTVAESADLLERWILDRIGQYASASEQ